MSDNSLQPTKVDARNGTCPAVELQHVTKRISRDFQIVDLSISLQPGEFLCLMGPSGSGKSTVLGLIGGWIRSDSGRILIDAEDVTAVAAYKRPIRTCFQKAGFLFPHMTVAENIAYPLRFKPGLSRTQMRERVDSLIERVGLAGFAGRMPHQLSGGESQRVSIARALADLQPVLLLDEIQTGLDRHLRHSIRELLVDLVRQFRLTALYVTHDPIEAFGLASRLHSRVGILVGGELQQLATPEELYRYPSTLFVASLLGDMNVFPVASATDGEIQTTLGTTLSRDSGICAGLKTVAFRCESVTFERPQEPAAVLVGTVERIEFLGQFKKVLLRVGLEQVAAHLPNSITTPPVGHDVHCYVRQADLMLLRS